MRWKMADNSLFAILLRSPWWLSLGVAAAVALATFALLPEAYRWFGPVSALPFAVIGVMAAWKQRHVPSAARVTRTVETVRAMPWSEFSSVLEAAYRRDGFEVTRLPGGAADFEVARNGRRTLVNAKRWKVVRTGVEPLRELAAAKAAREADDGVYIAVGEVTEHARKFAAGERIRLVGGAELAGMIPASREDRSASAAK